VKDALVELESPDPSYSERQRQPAREMRSSALATRSRALRQRSLSESVRSQMPFAARRMEASARQAVSQEVAPSSRIRF
jgi:hypothetical protein